MTGCGGPEPAREPVQGDPRHLRAAPYRCSLPGLAGFRGSQCAGLEPTLAPAPARADVFGCLRIL